MIIFNKSKLPEQWERTSLDTVVVLNPKLDKSQYIDDLLISFVPMPAVEAESGKIDVSQIKKFADVKKGYTAFQENDVLFAKITPCMENGKMAIAPSLTNKLGFGSTEFHVLRSYEGILPKYIYYYVSSKLLRIEAEHNMTGAVGQRRVPIQWLGNVEFPIPSTNEQNRIVSKIEELFSELDKGIESLKTAREQLKIYRQALLKHAFEGKLTEQWREDNADKLETADQLLELIKQEREDRYQKQLDDWNEAVNQWEVIGNDEKKPVKPKKPKVIKPNILIEKPMLPKQSEGWFWFCVGENNVDVFDGPFGSNLKTSDYVDSGVRVIRLENIGSLEFIDSKYSYVSEEKYQLLKKHTVCSGDIIFSSFVTENIRVAQLPRTINKAINKADCFCIRVFGKTINSNYLLYFLSYRFVFKQIEELIHGVGRPRINTTQLKGIWIPQCSINEQNKIVELLDEQLSDISQLENDIENNLIRIESLRQSILKKAFSGKLVPQDPNDKPASELLKRIAQEKAELEAQEKAAKAAIKKSKPKIKRKKVTTKTV